MDARTDHDGAHDGAHDAAHDGAHDADDRADLHAASRVARLDADAGVVDLSRADVPRAGLVRHHGAGLRDHRPRRRRRRRHRDARIGVSTPTRLDMVWSDGAGVIVGVAPGTGPHPEIVEGYREARRRGVGLLALTAYEPPDFWAVVPGSPPPSASPTATTMRESALEALVDTVARALTGAEPGDVARRVTCEVAPGTARGVLAAASTRAELVVIGTARRAEARYAGALSVAADCLRHARCTVRVVPDGVTPGRA